MRRYSRRFHSRRASGIVDRRRLRATRGTAATERSLAKAFAVAQRLDQRRVLAQCRRERPRGARDRDEHIPDEVVVARARRRAAVDRRGCGSSTAARAERIGRLRQGSGATGRVEDGIRARHARSVARAPPSAARSESVVRSAEGDSWNGGPRILVVMPRLRLAAAQLDLVVGDLAGNAERIFDAYEQADAAGCDLIAFPELALTGYPPEDLLLKPAFVAQTAETLEKLAARTGRLAAVIGFPEAGRDLANAAAVCAHGKVQGIYRKHLLPNYAVFDEQRYFTPVHGGRAALRHRRGARRHHHLRGRVEPDRSGHHPGRGRSRADREHQRVAVLRGAHPRARDDARDPGRRRAGPGRVRESRRRAGRARLRRRVDGVRRDRPARRPSQPVRRGPAHRRPRRAGRLPAPAARSRAAG